MPQTEPWESLFPRTDRFAYQRLLGTGAFGAVYQAYDRERDEVVALKTLHRLDADALLSLKREFRALADVTHPNLVRLYELLVCDQQWFITMEFVDGTDLLRFVRGQQAEARASMTLPDPEARSEPADPVAPSLPTSASTLDLDVEALSRTAADAETLPPASCPSDMTRLRHVFHQLAEGLDALHVGGRLHRDLKPSNVLVTRAGRVVIVDFGLVIESRSGTETSVSRVAGTPAYMAPEQAVGLQLSPASDWYATGVMLYESLTGRLPFQGPGLVPLFDKQTREPPPPRSLVAGIPEDLDALCEALLRRSPTSRPRASEIVERLHAPAAAASMRSLPSIQVPLVGRSPHLAVLRDAFALVAKGQAVTVHIRGTSGMGKTTLIRHFLDGLVREGAPVILEGRCYQRESVPYKGIDSVVDALAGYLSMRPTVEAALLLPRDAQAIVRLFPVLGQIAAVRRSPQRDLDSIDAQDLRRRGFAALRELLARIAEERPLVVHIDDLQWGDADGAALLAEIMRPPDPPALLFLASYRSDDADRSELLRNLPAWLGHDLERALSSNVVDLVVGPLEPSEAEILSQSLLGSEAAHHARSIAIESGYSPFFIQEMVKSLHEGRRYASTEPQEIRLEDVLSERLNRLPPDERRMLEIIAVSGRPLPRVVAGEAADIGTSRGHEAIAVLCSAHLVRTRGTRDDEELETFHDRIREAAVALLPADALTERHLALATALERSGSAEAHILGAHFRSAGQVMKAAEYMNVAGDHAAAALAFERAARHYSVALELCTATDPNRHTLLVKLGDAFSNAGRGAEAARAYLAASDGAPRGEAQELQRRAAENYLRSGYYDDGMACLREVLAAVDMRVPSTPRSALVEVVAARALLRLRGFRFEPRAASEVAPELLRRIDTCWSAAVGLGMIDNVRGAYFQARNLRLALDAGEPYRVARAMAFDVPFIALPGGRALPRAKRLLARAEQLAQVSANPHALALVRLVSGTMLYLSGSFRAAVAELDQAELMLRERCTGVSWERGSARVIGIWALWLCGDLREFAERVPTAIREAEERGDRYLAVNLCSYFSNAYWLLRGDPDAARRQADVAVYSWSRQGFHLQHFHDMVARASVALYVGDPAEAYGILAERWSQLQASLSLRMQTARVYATHLRARTALALARTVSRERRRGLLRRVTRDARALEREGVAWSEPLAWALRGGVAAVEGDDGGAAMSFARAASGFDDVGMALFAATARRRSGELLGGAGGEAMVAEANGWMVAQGVVDVDRIMAFMAPSA